MSNKYLIALAKNINLLVDQDTLIKFLKPGYGVDKYYVKLLAYLKGLYPIYKNSDNLASIAEKKTILKVAQVSKKNQIYG